MGTTMTHTDKDLFNAKRENSIMERKYKEKQRIDYPSKKRLLENHNDNKRSKTLPDRDISERITLGLSKIGELAKKDLFDPRLFNQTSGLHSGYGAEEKYDLYDER